MDRKIDVNKIKTKASTIARIAALLVAIINQCLALFGKDILPFGDNWIYQLITLIATVVVAVINCWYNNDITQTAKLTGKIFDALKDGNLEEKEIEEIIVYANTEESLVPGSETQMFLIGVANGILKTIKLKVSPEEKEKLLEQGKEDK